MTYCFPLDGSRRDVIGLLLAALLICNAGCDDQAGSDSAVAAPASDGPQRVVLVNVVSSEMRDVASLSATVIGYETAQLMSKIDGYVEAVEVNIGDRVEKDQVLAQLDVPEMLDEISRREQMLAEAEAAVESQEAQVKLAEAKRDEHDATLRMRESELERMTRLVGRGALKQQNLDEAQYAAEASRAARNSAVAEIAAVKAMTSSARSSQLVAEAELRKARSLDRYRAIRAPFAGLIAQRNVDSGSFVRPGTLESGMPLFEVVRDDQVRMIVFLPMEKAAKLQTGDPLVIHHVDSLPNIGPEQWASFPLAISRVARIFDQQARMMRAEVDIDNAKLQEAVGCRLTAGDYAHVDVILEDFSDASQVPTTAIGQDQDGPAFVVKVDGQRVCHRVPVDVRFAASNEAAVSADGLTTGDQLVAVAPERYSDGQNLENIEIAPKQ